MQVDYTRAMDKSLHSSVYSIYPSQDKRIIDTDIQYTYETYIITITVQPTATAERMDEMIVQRGGGERTRS